MYQALYRKWRPKTFSDVVGQEHVTETLQRQVAEGRLSHAYLFTGTRGTGKTTCAKILAKAVNCEHPENGNPCNKCQSCLGIESGGFLDVMELDAASNNGVDHVRALRDEAIYSPAQVKKRVYIIDEVHMLSKDAFNALLKIMEEPPEHLLFILATTELQKVLPTLLSRCQRFTFKRILTRDMEQHLLRVAEKEGIDLTADGAELLARMANGALRDALSLLDQCRAAAGTVDAKTVLDTLGLAGSTQTLQLMRLLLARQGGDALGLLDQLYRGGKDISALLGELSDLCRDMTVMKAAPEGGAALVSGVYGRKTLTDMTAEVPMRRLLFMTDTIQRTAAALGDSIRQRTDAELCLLRLCDESLSGDTAALDGRVSAIEEMLQKGVVPAQKAAVSRENRRAAEVRAAPLPAAVEAPAPERASPPAPPAEAAPQPVTETATQEPTETKKPEKPCAATISDGDSGVWNVLLNHYKAPLAASYRAMLDHVRGTLNGDILKVTCESEMFKSLLDCKAVRDVLEGVTSQHTGQRVQVRFAVGEVGKKSPATKSAAARRPRPAPPVSDDYERPPMPEEAPPAPEEAAHGGDIPPWEDAPATGDKLDELTRNGRKLDGFQIK